MSINRIEVSRSLAKAIAFKNVGKDKKAKWWARQLIHQLECAEILNDEIGVTEILKESKE